MSGNLPDTGSQSGFNAFLQKNIYKTLTQKYKIKNNWFWSIIISKYRYSTNKKLSSWSGSLERESKALLPTDYSR